MMFQWKYMIEFYNFIKTELKELEMLIEYCKGSLKMFDDVLLKKQV